MTTVLTVGVFDLMHPGHVIMLKDCKTYGDRLIVGVQSSDGVTQRVDKRRPILSMEERCLLVASVRWVDEIFNYETEGDLHRWLVENFSKYDIRIIGSDHLGKPFTGDDIPGMMEKVRWHVRGTWSTTGVIERIRRSLI